MDDCAASPKVTYCPFRPLDRRLRKLSSLPQPEPPRQPPKQMTNVCYMAAAAETSPGERPR